MRRAALAIALVAAFAVSAAPSAAAPTVDGRLQGKFTMNGTITRADNVQGESRGDHIKRTWTFDSKCAAGPCDSVVLRRERSAGKVDKMTLTRDGPGRYSGKNLFHFPLRCAGRVYPHGGEARYTITVRTTAATDVQGAPFATDARAKYKNTSRINHTQCGGDLGLDAASYSGSVDRVPGPPHAAFVWTKTSPPSQTVAFKGKSKRGTGGASIVSRSWDFGDSNPATNTDSGKAPSHTFSAPNTYTVMLTVTDTNGLTGTISHPVTVP